MALVSSYNDDYGFTLFAYRLNSISFILTFIGNLFLIIINIFRIKFQANEITTGVEEVDVFIRIVNVTITFVQIALYLYTIFTSYSVNHLLFSFLKAIGKRDYQLLVGKYLRIYNGKRK